MLSAQGVNDLDSLLSDLEDEPGLTEWEHEFINNLIEDLELYSINLHLTPARQEILDRIEEKFA